MAGLTGPEGGSKEPRDSNGHEQGSRREQRRSRRRPQAHVRVTGLPSLLLSPLICSAVDAGAAEATAWGEKRGFLFNLTAVR